MSIATFVMSLSLAAPSQAPAAVPARGEDMSAAEQTLEAARQEIADLEYDQAALLLQDVVTDVSAPESTLREAHRHLGSVEVIRGRFAEARLHFRWILVRQPEYRLPVSEPPKVQGYFNDVRKEVIREQASRPAAPVAAVDETVAEDVAEDEGGIPLWPVVAGGVAAGAIVVVGASVGVGAAAYFLSQPSLGTVDFR